ncbi:MAG: hypothetical protein ACRELG_13800 [Gemmataceae bacterium]
MNRRIRQAMLKILLLREEFSAQELSEAVALIDGGEENVLALLKRIAPESPQQAAPRSPGASFSTKGETRALQELKHSDGEKYEVLRDFETLIREGSTLQTLDEFRAFGKILGKDFSPGKSRKEALARLMALLAHMDLDSIRAALNRLPASTTQEATAFHRLADKIISGASDRSPRRAVGTQ